VGPVSLSRVFERTDLRVDEVASYYRSSLEDGRPATDLADARRIVNGAPRSGDSAEADTLEDAAADDPDAATTDDPADDEPADDGADEDSDGGTP
jgi:hypothetical protein